MKNEKDLTQWEKDFIVNSCDRELELTDFQDFKSDKEHKIYPNESGE